MLDLPDLRHYRRVVYPFFVFLLFHVVEHLLPVGGASRRLSGSRTGISGELQLSLDIYIGAGVAKIDFVPFFLYRTEAIVDLPGYRLHIYTSGKKHPYAHRSEVPHFFPYGRQNTAAFRHIEKRVFQVVVGSAGGRLTARPGSTDAGIGQTQEILSRAHSGGFPAGGEFVQSVSAPVIAGSTEWKIGHDCRQPVGHIRIKRVQLRPLCRVRKAVQLPRPPVIGRLHGIEGA